MDEHGDRSIILSRHPVPATRDREGFYSGVLLLVLEDNFCQYERLDHRFIDNIATDLQSTDYNTAFLIRTRDYAHWIVVIRRNNNFVLLESKARSAFRLSLANLCNVIRRHYSHPGAVYRIKAIVYQSTCCARTRCLNKQSSLC